ncbi:Omp28-related outer membrane protein [Mesonia aquimarina]|uniref:Omp28-related outer membrane protein n=1 Tax=Mesonia aquimarina TaxID=1504967 RepID=UPI000EF61A83|nr:Omp28-related outer membrane protein [Mesonia aquimarina]
MSKILKYSLSLFILVMFACSSEYDYSVNVDTENLSFVTLNTNLTEKSTVGLEELVSFNLTNDVTGENISEAATFFINEEAISGNSYELQEAGTYEIYATIEDITSNTIQLDVVDGKYVSVNLKVAMKGQTVLFKAFDTDGTEITDESAFIVNDNPINGNEFSSEQSGTYSVVAQHQGTTTAITTFEIYTAKRKVALEDYTGGWCGWCPRVLLVIEEVEKVTEDVVTLAVHNNDEMEFEQEEVLRNSFDVGSSLPKLRANRTDNINVIQDSQIPNAVDYIASMAGAEINNAIAINTKLYNDQLKVNVELISEESLPSSYKLAVYLYQDGLAYEQTNYYNNSEGSKWYQQGNPIPDFVHNHVLEASLTENLLGDNIENISAFETLNRNIGTFNLSRYSHTDNGNTFDPSRFGVAVFLVDENNNAINAQSVKAGKNVSFNE